MVRKLFICFLLLFCFNSTVLASLPKTDLNANEAEYIFKYLFTDEYYSNRNLCVNSVSPSNPSQKISFSESAVDAFMTYFNRNNTLNIDNDNTIYIVRYAGSNQFSLYYANFNNTFSNIYPYLRFNRNSANSGTITAVESQENLSGIDIELHVIDGTLDLSNNSIIYRNYRTTQIGSGFDFNIIIPQSWFKNADTDILDPIPGICTLSPNTTSIYSNLLSNGTTVNPPVAVFLTTYYEFVDVPEIPSGDTPGSGESGSIDLSGIQTGINNINNNLNNIENKIPTSGDIKETISGEVGKITETLTTVPDLSGEIITKQEIDDALNLDFMADPYDNFWYELTTGLSHALTDNVRQYDIPWINGYVYTFNLDTWGLKFPPAIEFVLRSMSVIAITWVIVKYWKIIVDKISSGSIDEVLAMNEEEGIIDLF